jgi:hypothetical protein
MESVIDLVLIISAFIFYNVHTIDLMIQCRGCVALIQEEKGVEDAKSPKRVTYSRCLDRLDERA